MFSPAPRAIAHFVPALLAEIVSSPLAPVHGAAERHVMQPNASFCFQRSDEACEGLRGAHAKRGARAGTPECAVRLPARLARAVSGACRNCVRGCAEHCDLWNARQHLHARRSRERCIGASAPREIATLMSCASAAILRFIGRGAGFHAQCRRAPTLDSSNASQYHRQATQCLVRTDDDDDDQGRKPRDETRDRARS